MASTLSDLVKLFTATRHKYGEEMQSETPHTIRYYDVMEYIGENRGYTKFTFNFNRVSLLKLLPHMTEESIESSLARLQYCMHWQ